MGQKCCAESAKHEEQVIAAATSDGQVLAHAPSAPALPTLFAAGPPDAGKAAATPALAYHEGPTPGKFDIVATKAMNTQQDLSLAYSPGVAEPCLAIQASPEDAYRYTNKGNMVACISNGTAVLGLGDIGALASKPVMEGKSVLFKKFAGVNCVDLCVDCPDKEEFVRTVKHLAPSFGGINLEDIKGPDCFFVEEQLKAIMPIPVFHDDQHGTAIVCLAGLINAIEISGKAIGDIKIVCNGAGAAGIACMKLIQGFGARPEKCVVCDTNGVIYRGRKKGMNAFKESLATASVRKDTTLEEACVGADVLIGVSKAGAFTEGCMRALAKNPVIFAMANPEPEIRPELAKKIRPDCIIATGRSDYPNQINNVMCFPFLFRAALDCRASQINEDMKMAAAKALADLSRRPVPDAVRRAMPGRDFAFGRDYVIPTPFDPRLIEVLPAAVARAAAESGVAQRPIQDYEGYAKACARLVA
uniref:Malic enzyme n=1 Tax=Zooxanthella nutricula TaxID=1333877 RepID=A0A6U6UJ78_9DINO